MALLRARGAGWLLVFVIAAACAGQHPRAASAPTAEAIVQRMAAMYRSAATYTDHGVQVMELSHTGGTLRVAFDTAFARARGFRFESLDAPDRRRLVFQTTLGKGDAANEHRSLFDASLTSHIPRLLVPSIRPGSSVAERRPLRLAGVEPIFGHPCWRVISGTGDDAVTLWIDQRSYLLRRAESRHHVPERIDHPAFDTHETTIYHPSLNGPIAASLENLPDPATQPASTSDPWLGMLLDGRRIGRVITGSPADRAGLQRGDEVISLDGSPVKDPAAIVELVGRKAIGESAAIVVRRGGQQLELVATIGDRREFERPQRDLLDKPAPALAATVVAGTYAASSAELAGHVTVLAFLSFGTCSDCPVVTYLSKLQARYGARGVRVIGLSGEPEAALRAFAVEHALPYSLAHDDGTIAAAFHTYEPATFVVIDRAGVVRYIGDMAPIEDLVILLLDS